MGEYGESSSAGVRLRGGLGWAVAEDCGRYVAWSPDGRLLALPGGTDLVRIVDAESGTNVAIVPADNGGTLTFVDQVAWSPDGVRLAGACGYGGVQMWRPRRPDRAEHLSAHRDWVGQVAWASGGGLLASGARDQTVRIWDTDSRRLLHTIEEHSDSVGCLAWAPDGKTLATATVDGHIRLWSVSAQRWDRVNSPFHTLSHPHNVTCLGWSADGKMLVVGMGDGVVDCLSTGDPVPHLTTLEGHTAAIGDVGFSADGRLLATAAEDLTIRLWRTDDWSTVATLRLPHTDTPAFAFHPALARFAVWTPRAGLSVWDYDLDVLLGEQSAVESVRYTTAKVVLVGDSGVGKTGLGWRLAHDEFREHASTHGQQFWVVDDVRTRRADGTDCEAVLWDLAGQHVYRSVHAIFLDNVDLALVLFDPTNRQEPMKGVRFWLQQLSGGRRLPPAVLVGARVDRGAPAMSREELDQFCQRHEISGGYVSTSAATGVGVEELMGLLRGQIRWEAMTTTVTTVTFKRIKEFVLAQKEQLARRQTETDPVEVLMFPADLRRRLQETDPDWEFTDAEMMTAVGHLENHGYVFVLRTSSGAQAILLAPELLVGLASSVFLQADKDPQQLGAISEVALLGGQYPFADLDRLAPAEQRVLLDAAVVRFLEHNLCFRDTLGAEILLIFPALIKQKRPLVDTVETVDDVTYLVNGRVENVYPALVVLLGHTRTFTGVNYWHNQAQFEMGSGQICGLRVLQEREGEIELVLHYSEAVPPYGRNMFQGLFESFLYKRDVTVTVFPAVVCPRGHRQDRTAVMGLLRDRETRMFCFKCGTPIDLPETEGPVAFGAEDKRLVGQDRATARLRSTYETYLVRVKSFRADRTVPRAYLSRSPEDATWGTRLTRDLREAGVLVVQDARDVRDDDVVLALVTPAYVDALTRGAGADLDLIRARRWNGNGNGDGQRPLVVPLLCAGDGTAADGPPELRGLVAGDFRDESRYAVELFDLVLTLYAIPFNHPAFTPLRETLRRTWVEQDTERQVMAPVESAASDPPAEQDAHVYLSYSWSEESNALADQLDAAFQVRGLTMVRDRRDAGYKASISRFMERIGRGKCVVLVIGDAYLRSRNCLFELLEIAEHGEFHDRVFPVVLPDARIHEPHGVIDYMRYWEEKRRELEEGLKSIEAANQQGLREDIDLYARIRARLPGLVQMLGDMNTLTVDLHRDSVFSEIHAAVMSRINL